MNLEMANRHGDAALRMQVIHKLNRALATELVCMFRSERHYQLARDVYGPAERRQLQAQARAELRHAEAIAERIVELGGRPDLALDTLGERSYVDWAPVDDDGFLPALAEDDLVAGRIATDAYRELIEDLGDHDPDTGRLLAQLLVPLGGIPGAPGGGRVEAQAGENPSLQKATRPCAHGACSCVVTPSTAVVRGGDQYCSIGCAEGHGCEHENCECIDGERSVG